MTSNTAGKLGSKLPPENSLISAPPENKFCLDEITMTATDSSAIASFKCAIRATRTDLDNALTGGFCIHKTAILLADEVSISSQFTASLLTAFDST